MQTYQDRLMHVINKVSDGNKKRFARRTEINSTSIYEVFLKTRKLSGENSNKLIKVGVNLNWLNTGEGEPFIESQESGPISQLGTAIREKKSKEHQEAINDLRMTIEAQAETIKLLKEKIERLEKKN